MALQYGAKDLEMDRTRVWLDFYICDGGNSCFLLLISLSMKS